MHGTFLSQAIPTVDALSQAGVAIAALFALIVAVAVFGGIGWAFFKLMNSLMDRLINPLTKALDGILDVTKELKQQNELLMEAIRNYSTAERTQSDLIRSISDGNSANQKTIEKVRDVVVASDQKLDELIKLAKESRNVSTTV